MNIYVNGEEMNCLESRTPREFIHSARLNPEELLIVLNSEAIQEEELDIELQEGDRLELLRFAGGG